MATFSPSDKHHPADELAASLNPLLPGTSPYTGPDRRASGERREYSLSTLKSMVLRPQRSGGRRRDDRRYPLVDIFDSGLLALAVLLVTFSALDAIFTLTLLSHGGSELNPVMNYFLKQGTSIFITVKLILTAIPAVILVATGNVLLFGKIRARTILAALVGLYAGLMVYELGLLSTI